MASDTELAFRSSERILDRLVADARSLFQNHNIELTDTSLRDYHYDPLLFWSYQFEHRKSHGGPEIASVIVYITLNEPMDLTKPQIVEIQTRSEIFQIGQESRWQHSKRQNLLVPEIADLGIGRVVLENIDQGHGKIESTKSK